MPKVVCLWTSFVERERKGIRRGIETQGGSNLVLMVYGHCLGPVMSRP